MPVEGLERLRITYTETGESGCEIAERDGRLTLRGREVSGTIGICFESSDEYELVLVEYPAGQAPEVLEIAAVSGEIEVHGAELRTARLESTSGEIELEDVTAEEVFVRTVSGELSGELRTGTLRFESTFGGVELELDAQRAEFRTVSGDVLLELPGSAADYGVDMDSVSGTLYCGDGKRGGRIITGRSAPRQIVFDTTSGDLTLCFD